MSKLKDRDPELYRFLQQAHEVDSLKRDDLVAVTTELAEAHKDVSA